jgi:hypothetical protein
MGHKTLPVHPAKAGTTAFTTIEVLVAVLLCSITFLGLYAGLASGFTFVQLARENLRGTQILEEKMETIRLYRWDQVTNTTFIPTNFVDTFYPLGTQSTAGLTYTGVVTITDAPLTEYYADSLKQVRVDLSWKSGSKVRTRQMTTLVSQYGLQNYVYGSSR